MESLRFKKLKQNKFNLFFCRLFIELNAIQAVIQLFYLHRGLTVSEIFYLAIAWSMASIIFDIPTSFLADKWGRKNIIILGVVINIIANFAVIFSYGFTSFFLNTFILSVSFSMLSGVEDAFMFDTLKEMGQENVVLKTSGKYAIASRISKLFTPLVGVIIATNLAPLEFNILLLINLISSFIALFYGIKLVEPFKSTETNVSRLQLLQNSFIQIWQTPILTKIIFNKTLIFIASYLFVKFYQKILYDLGISVLMLGLIYTLFNTVAIIIFSKADYIFKYINKRVIFELPIWAIAIGCFIFTFSQNKWLLYTITIFLMITGIIRDPFFNQQIQWRLKSYNRATTGSVMGLFKSIIDIPILMISGYIASINTNIVMLIPVALSLLTLLFFRMNKKDILSEVPAYHRP